jgi:uncharacterized RDD family membrane protein YckC
MVTGEAVPLDLRIAQLPSRSMAITVDLTIQIGLLIGALVLLSAFAGSGANQATVDATGLLLGVAIVLGYPVVWETLSRGRSPGKFAVGLRVVRDDGGATRFRHAVLRGLLEVVEIWMLFGIPAVLCSLLNPRGKRLGDLAAGTVVIRERSPRGRPTPQSYVHPLVQAWATAADLSRVGDDLALAIRSFLARASSLRPESRAQLGQQLFSDVLTRVAPPPPWGTPQEMALTAVLAERRRRAEGRLPSPVHRPAAPTGVAPPPAEPAPPPVAGTFQLPG